MAEVKKLWLVTDAPKYQGTLDYLWEDPAMNGEEHRLAHFCGALVEGGYSVDQFVRVYFGGGLKTLQENPKTYDDEASARKDANQRLDRARKSYEKRTGKTAPRTASLAERVVARYQGPGIMIDPKQIVARYKGASKYDQTFQAIVQVVDALEEAAKKIPKALDSLSDLSDHINNDPDVAEQPGLNKYAPEQQIGYLKDSFKNVQKHVNALVEQYEDSNKTFLRMKLR